MGGSPLIDRSGKNNPARGLSACRAGSKYIERCYPQRAAVKSILPALGDTASLQVTLHETEQRLAEVRAAPKEVVGDKAYQSNATMTGVKKRGSAHLFERAPGPSSWLGACRFARGLRSGSQRDV